MCIIVVHKMHYFLFLTKKLFCIGSHPYIYICCRVIPVGYWLYQIPITELLKVVYHLPHRIGYLTVINVVRFSPNSLQQISTPIHEHWYTSSQTTANNRNSQKA